MEGDKDPGAPAPEPSTAQSLLNGGIQAVVDTSNDQQPPCKSPESSSSTTTTTTTTTSTMTVSQSHDYSLHHQHCFSDLQPDLIRHIVSFFFGLTPARETLPGGNEEAEDDQQVNPDETDDENNDNTHNPDEYNNGSFAVRSGSATTEPNKPAMAKNHSNDDDSSYAGSSSSRRYLLVDMKSLTALVLTCRTLKQAIYDPQLWSHYQSMTRPRTTMKENPRVTVPGDSFLHLTGARPIPEQPKPSEALVTTTNLLPSPCTCTCSPNPILPTSSSETAPLVRPCLYPPYPAGFAKIGISHPTAFPPRFSPQEDDYAYQLTPCRDHHSNAALGASTGNLAEDRCPQDDSNILMMESGRQQLLLVREHASQEVFLVGDIFLSSFLHVPRPPPEHYHPLQQCLQEQFVSAFCYSWCCSSNELLELHRRHRNQHQRAPQLLRVPYISLQLERYQEETPMTTEDMIYSRTATTVVRRVYLPHCKPITEDMVDSHQGNWLLLRHINNLKPCPPGHEKHQLSSEENHQQRLKLFLLLLRHYQTLELVARITVDLALLRIMKTATPLPSPMSMWYHWQNLMKWACRTVHVFELPVQVAFRTAALLRPLFLQRYFGEEQDFGQQGQLRRIPYHLLAAAVVYIASSLGGGKHDGSDGLDGDSSGPTRSTPNSSASPNTATATISLEALAFCARNLWSADTIEQVVCVLWLNRGTTNNCETNPAIPSLHQALYATPTMNQWIRVHMNTTATAGHSFRWYQSPSLSVENEDEADNSPSGKHCNVCTVAGAESPVVAEDIKTLALDLAWFLLPMPVCLNQNAGVPPRIFAACLVVVARWVVQICTPPSPSSSDSAAPPPPPPQFDVALAATLWQPSTERLSSMLFHEDQGPQSELQQAACGIDHYLDWEDDIAPLLPDVLKNLHIQYRLHHRVEAQNNNNQFLQTLPSHRTTDDHDNRGPRNQNYLETACSLFLQLPSSTP